MLETAGRRAGSRPATARPCSGRRRGRRARRRSSAPAPPSGAVWTSVRPSSDDGEDAHVAAAGVRDEHVRAVAGDDDRALRGQVRDAVAGAAGREGAERRQRAVGGAANATSRFAPASLVWTYTPRDELWFWDIASSGTRMTLTCLCLASTRCVTRRPISCMRGRAHRQRGSNAVAGRAHRRNAPDLLADEGLGLGRALAERRPPLARRCPLPGRASARAGDRGARRVDQRGPGRAYPSGVSEDACEPYGGWVEADGDVLRVRYGRVPFSHPDDGRRAPELPPIPLSAFVTVTDGEL